MDDDSHEFLHESLYNRFIVIEIGCFLSHGGTPKSSKIGPFQYGNLPNLQTKGHEWHQLPSPSEETCKDFGTGKKIGFHTLFDPPMVCSTSLVVTFMNRFTSDGLRLSEIGSTGPDISIFGMANTSFFGSCF